MSGENASEQDRKAIEAAIKIGDYTAADYRNAPSGKGPLAYEWKDKPHRLVYDLLACLSQGDEGERTRKKAERKGYVDLAERPAWGRGFDDGWEARGDR